MQELYASEAHLQKKVCQYLDIVLPDFSIYHHSANEGRGNKVQFYMKLYLMGFKSGWPDLEIFVPDCKPIFLELKRPGNYATPKQKAIHKLLEYAGTHVFICKSLQDVYQSLVNIVPLKKHQAATSMILHEQTLEADIKKMKRLKKEGAKK